ncbi:MAG: sensor histidine kinase [Alcanivoracaceae bacterium]|nr:sensor histidine kinase [Alcanivoracaceae bacterium]
MKKLLKNIDKKLLPDHDDFHYGPYIWLIYLVMFFISLAAYHPVKYSYWYAAMGTFLFLVVYFNGYWVSANKIKWNILAILIIGSFLAQLTSGASVFFVYAGAFCCMLGSSRKALIALMIIVAWIGLLSFYFGHSLFFYMPAIFFTLMIGGINIYQHDITLKRKELILSQQEVSHLAKISERERIARDLHDLIGHTFSVITLKAELAGKLIEKNQKKALAEILELENISRDALKQIREVVTGYRSSDLNTELAHAKYVLESNNIHFEYHFDDIELKDETNKELAIILKELVTNILKHAQADKAEVLIKQDNNMAVLLVQDNGKGFSKDSGEGFGLKGINERITKMSGQFKIESSSGAKLTVSVPLGHDND